MLVSKMLKRKGSRASVDGPITFVTKKQRIPWYSKDEQKGSVDCSSPKDLIQSLLGDTKTEDFYKTYWEKQPLHVTRNDAGFYGSLFTLSVMKEVLKTNELDLFTDLIVYNDEMLNELGTVTVERADELLDEKKATFQFYHPQRYIDELWKILEKLETHFGCLVGSSAFVTPADSRGQPPHCDDVETFILAVEGEVEWKLYKPMVELSRDYTQDLLEGTIGDPVMTVVVQPGDLLYFTRGTIYQCKTSEKGHSAYISVSTYLQNTWGDLMCHAVSRAIENAMEDDVSFRSGLPVNYGTFLGTGLNMSNHVEYAEKDGVSRKQHTNVDNPEVIEFKKTVQSYLSKLVDHIDVNMAADSMCQEFMGSRLPPYGHVHEEGSQDAETEGTADENVAPASDNVPEADEKDSSTVVKTNTTDTTIMPTINDQIRIRYPEHIRLVYCEEEEDDSDSEISDSDDEEEEMEIEEENAEEPEGKKKSLVKKSKSPGKKSKSPGKKSKSPGKDARKPSEGDDDDDEDAEIDDTEPHVKILHSLHNDRFSHMGFNIYEEVGSLKLSVNFAEAIVELLKCKDFVAVKDILMEDDDDKLLVATKFARDGLIEVKTE